MLARRELIDLERSLRDVPVLSAYVDGTVRDPAQRSVWRTRLQQELGRIRANVTDRAERHALDQATSLLRDELAAVAGAIGTGGWVAFVAPDGIRYRDALPVPPPLYVRWGRGMAIAPALRALKELRPAVVAVVDSRSARLFRYHDAMLDSLETLHAYTPIDPVVHMGAPPRQGFHTGTRGRTGADAAARELRAGRAQLMRELATRMLDLAGSDGWLLFGGTPEAAHEASVALPAPAAGRMLLMPELHVWSSDGDIARSAAHGASALRQREDLATVRTILDHADGGGHAAIRMPPVARALEAGAVQRLFVTVHFLDDHPERVEALVQRAFDQGGDVEVVSGPGAELLDTEAQGVGALLRFALPDRAGSAGHQMESRPAG